MTNTHTHTHTHIYIYIYIHIHYTYKYIQIQIHIYIQKCILKGSCSEKFPKTGALTKESFLIKNAGLDKTNEQKVLSKKFRKIF